MLLPLVLQVAQMTRSELPYADRIFLGPLAMFINLWKGPFVSEIFLLHLLLVSANNCNI